MAADASAAVRAAVAISLRDVPVENSGPLLVQIANGYDGKDATYLEAFGLGCESKEREIYVALRVEQPPSPEEWSPAFARIAWRLGSSGSTSGLLARALSKKLPLEERNLMVTAIAFINDPNAVEAMADIFANKDAEELKESAQWWLANRKTNEWRNYAIDLALQERGLSLPKPARLISVISPEPPETPSTLPSEQEIVALTGDPERGRAAAAVCYSCHKIGAVGAEFAPDLTVFGKTQPREVLVHAIVNPSAEISHGFEGSRIEVGFKRDDKWTISHTIDGIIVSDADPLLIKCVGGMVQKVERSRLATVRRLPRSLMPQPELLGLDAQKISDIVAYLQSEGVK
jgi:putative heme-binding domain-containing protein